MLVLKQAADERADDMLVRLFSGKPFKDHAPCTT